MGQFSFMIDNTNSALLNNLNKILNTNKYRSQQKVMLIVKYTIDTERKLIDLYKKVFPEEQFQFVKDEANGLIAFGHENDYGGYGIFGGIDIFQAIAYLNGFTTRDHGLDLRFKTTYSLPNKTRADKKKLEGLGTIITPQLVMQSTNLERYRDSPLPPLLDDPYQGNGGEDY